jgi:hypothetical protein
MTGPPGISEPTGSDAHGNVFSPLSGVNDEALACGAGTRLA